MRSIEFFILRRTLIGFLALAIGLTAISLLAVLRGSIAVQYVGAVGLALFGAALKATHCRLRTRGPIVTIDEEGMDDRRIGPGRIEWHAVAAVDLRCMQGQPFLCVWLHDPNQYYATLPPLRRILARANAALGFGHAAIGFRGVTPGIDVAWRFVVVLHPEKIAEWD